MNDATTFFLCFLAVFGGIAAVLLHLESRANAIEARLATLEAADRAPAAAHGADATTKAKPGPADGRPKA